MMKPVARTQIVDGKRYTVAEGQDPLCGDDWWDGHNHERSGTQCFLFRTSKGSYFFQRHSQWQGSPGCWHEPCTLDEAVEFWEACHKHGEACSFEVAFPGIEVPDA